MKFIHLSDLHLGKRIHEMSMYADQKYIIEKITEIIACEKPDAVLIAGDIYDRAQPSGEAMRILDDFLVELSDMGVEVFAISGNHDSADRISFGSRLMDRSGIHMSTAFDGSLQKHVFRDKYGDVNIYMLPFIKPINVRAFHDEIERDDYTGAIREVIGAANGGSGIDRTQRNILIAHQYVTGAERSDSEEQIGGLENADAKVFADFDYTALGHLHRPQEAESGSSDAVIRYCGTPLKYSFSEINDRKSVTIVEIGKKGKTDIKTTELKPLHEMRQIKGTFDEIMHKTFWEGTDYPDAYVSITLTDQDIIPDAVRKLRSVYHNILEMKYEKDFAAQTDTAAGTETNDKTPMEIFEEFFHQAVGRPLTDVMRRFIKEKMDKVGEEEK